MDSSIKRPAGAGTPAGERGAPLRPGGDREETAGGGRDLLAEMEEALLLVGLAGIAQDIVAGVLNGGASVRFLRIQRAVGAIKTRQLPCFSWILV